MSGLIKVAETARRSVHRLPRPLDGLCMYTLDRQMVWCFIAETATRSWFASARPSRRSRSAGLQIEIKDFPVLARADTMLSYKHFYILKNIFSHKRSRFYYF